MRQVGKNQLAALAEKPKLVLVESPSNPLLRVVDIAKICHLAREVGAVSVVDNTFLSPALQNPLALGADLVLHSCTKYLNGHSDVVAGVVIAKDPDVVTELAWWANNIGVTGGAFDSYLLLRGLRTLVPRMELACWCPLIYRISRFFPYVRFFPSRTTEIIKIQYKWTHHIIHDRPAETDPPGVLT